MVEDIGQQPVKQPELLLRASGRIRPEETQPHIVNEVLVIGDSGQIVEAGRGPVARPKGADRGLVQDIQNQFGLRLEPAVVPASRHPTDGHAVVSCKGVALLRVIQAVQACRVLLVEKMQARQYRVSQP